MAAHAIDLDTDVGPEATGYRWRCSCGERAKRWRVVMHYDWEPGSYTRAARAARTGGARHVAAMERGR